MTATRHLIAAFAIALVFAAHAEEPAKKPAPISQQEVVEAVLAGKIEIVEKALEQGYKVDARAPGNRTALMFAASGPNAKAVKLLLDSGAKINMADSNEHFTALMWAAAEGQAEVVKLLLKHKADATLKDVDSDTAESFAAQKGHTAVVKILQEAAKMKEAPPKE